MESKWLSVQEYAAYKKKSISTVRRYIRADRVKYRDEGGKYFIWTKNYISQKSESERKQLSFKLEFERLKKENIDLKEELAEVKMLIQLYEKGNVSTENRAFTLPEIPQSL